MKSTARVRHPVLRVILADAQLELVPEEIAGHPAVRKHAQGLGKKPSSLLLDANQHQPALKGLDDGARRGRPDIVQYCLHTLMESPLNKSGGLEVGIHTLHGDWIRLRPDTRLPRGEARLQGVLAKVLAEGKSQEKDPLVWSEGRLSAEQVRESFGRGPTVRLDPAGRPMDFAQLPSLADGGELCIVVGGFAVGEFSPEWQAAAPDPVSLWPEPLCAWAVLAECAAAWRQTAPSPGGSTPPSS